MDPKEEGPWQLDGVNAVTAHPASMWLFHFFESYPFIGTLFILQMLDIITGFAAAFLGGKASSSASSRGMLRKAIAWAVIIAFAVAGREVPAIPTAKIMALYFILTELLSLLENVALCGLKLPPGLTNGLRVIRDLRVNVDKAAYVKAVSGPNGPAPLVIKEIYINNELEDGKDGHKDPPAPALPVPLPVTIVNTPEDPANVSEVNPPAETGRIEPSNE